MTAPQPAPAAVPDGMAVAFESDCAAREAGFEAIRRDLAKRAPAPAAADARDGERVSVDAAALEHARACAIAYGAIPAGCDDIDEGCDLASAVAGLSATARPLPTAAGAVDGATRPAVRMSMDALCLAVESRVLAKVLTDRGVLDRSALTDAFNRECDARAEHIALIFPDAPAHAADAAGEAVGDD